MNIRLNKLKVKQLYKIHETFCPKDDLWPPTYYNLGDCEIEDLELQPRRPSLAQQIMENIFLNNQDCPWYDPTKPTNRTDSAPIYT